MPEEAEEYATGSEQFGAQSWIGVNEIKYEDGHWTYTDESGVVWNYVLIYEDKPVTELESEWETEDTRFDPWSFWSYQREPVVDHGLRAVTLSSRPSRSKGGCRRPPKSSASPGRSPKEKKSSLAKAVGLIELGLEWGEGGKEVEFLYSAYQYHQRRARARCHAGWQGLRGQQV